MPGTDNTEERSPRRRLAANLSDDTRYLGEKLEDLAGEVKALRKEHREDIRSLRDKAPSPKLLISTAVGLVTLVMGMFFASQMYLVGLIATSRGVDVAPAAGAATEVIRAGTTTVVESAGVTTTVETKKTEDVPAAVEP
jgi:hypothetical protein